MKHYRIALLSAIVAMSMVLVAVPALGSSSSVSWDYPTGLTLTPGSEVQIRTLAVPDPAGWECTAAVETTNGLSQHAGNNLNVYLNGGLLVTLQDFENVAYETNAAAAGFNATGSDQLVVKIESTGARVTSSTSTRTRTRAAGASTSASCAGRR